MNWNFNGQTVETFAIETDANNHLTSIANSNYRLDLAYDLASEKTESGLDLPLISEIIRMGPGFAETLTPRYVTPADGSNPKLDGIEIVRHTNGDLQSTTDDVIIIEDYDTAATGLPTALRRQVDGVMIVDVAKTGSPSEEPMRFESLTSGAGNANETYDEEGSLTNLDRPGAAAAAIQYDAFRRIRGITQNQAGRNYAYDMKAKRIREYQAESGRRIVYAYSGSRVIAIGTTGIDLEQGTAQAGDIIWTHAIGYGPFGPAFVKNLDGQGFSYFIFTDHLGTPFAYHNPVTGQTYYTPYNPWGELLAQQPNTPPAASGQSAPATPYGDQQAVTTAGFSLPADHIFDISPIALAGHLIDHQTGLIYMHNRYYSPRLGHFLTPDFRLPNLLDCSSFKEPYAYAAGNPLLYFDLDGLSRQFFIQTPQGTQSVEIGLALDNFMKGMIKTSDRELMKELPTLFQIFSMEVDSLIGEQVSGPWNLENAKTQLYTAFADYVIQIYGFGHSKPTRDTEFAYWGLRAIEDDFGVKFDPKFLERSFGYNYASLIQKRMAGFNVAENLSPLVYSRKPFNQINILGATANIAGKVTVGFEMTTLREYSGYNHGADLTISQNYWYGAGSLTSLDTADQTKALKELVKLIENPETRGQYSKATEKLSDLGSVSLYVGRGYMFYRHNGTPYWVGGVAGVTSSKAPSFSSEFAFYESVGSPKILA